MNNDGNRKVGFFAPSVDGHADVVEEGTGGLRGRRAPSACSDTARAPPSATPSRSRRRRRSAPTPTPSGSAGSVRRSPTSVTSIRRRGLRAWSRWCGPAAPAAASRSPMACSSPCSISTARPSRFGNASPSESDDHDVTASTGWRRRHQCPPDRRGGYGIHRPAGGTGSAGVVRRARMRSDDAAERLATFLEQDPETTSRRRSTPC